MVQRSNLLHGILRISRRYGEEAVQALVSPLTNVFLDFGRDFQAEILPSLPPAIKIVDDSFNNPEVINAIEEYPLIKKILEKFHDRVNTVPPTSPNIPAKRIISQKPRLESILEQHPQPSVLAMEGAPPHSSMPKEKPLLATPQIAKKELTHPPILKAKLVDIADEELNLAPPPHPSTSFLPNVLPATPQLAKKELTHPPILKAKLVDIGDKELNLPLAPSPSPPVTEPVAPDYAEEELNLVAPPHLSTQSEYTKLMGSPPQTKSELIKHRLHCGS